MKFEYNPLEDVMEEVGLQEMKTYIYRRQNTVVKFIVTRTIMDLFMVKKRRPDPRISKQWW